MTVVLSDLDDLAAAHEHAGGVREFLAARR
jgi:hypothetical protein